MCYLASEISALAAECARFTLAQDEAIEKNGGREAVGETVADGGGGIADGSGVKV